MNDIFSIPVRVYYEDTDAERIVYYANYLRFAERARTEFLRALNITAEMAKDGSRCGFVARHVELDYKNSAFLDDLLTVTCEIKELKNSSVNVYQEIKKDQDVLCTINITLVYINIDRHRPTRIPDQMRQALN